MAKTAKSAAKPAFSESYRHAEDAWFDGDFSGAIAILEGAHPRTATERADQALLAARSLIRIGAYQDALDRMRAIAAVGGADRQATMLMLSGAALSRLGRFEESREVLSTASSLKGVHRTIAAEILLERARIHFQNRGNEADALETCRRLTVDALGKADDIVLARAQEMLGYVNVAERKYADAAKSFRQGLSTMQRTRHRDAMLEAKILHMAVALAAERMDVEMLDIAAAAFGRIAWTSEMAEPRFQVSQNLGWLNLIAGNVEPAWRCFQDALTAASDDCAYRAMALTNLAGLHRVIGETFSATRFLEEAEILVQDTDWAALDADRRMALLEWIIEARRQARPIALEMVDQFRRFPDGNGIMGLDRKDPRALALFDTARSLVQRSKDDKKKRGAALMDRAIQKWLSLGFCYRAATLALDAYRFSDDPLYVDIANDAAQGVKTGWLRAIIRESRRKESRGLGNLTPAERDMLFRILAGKTGAQIASETGRSLQTVKNITRALFKRMDVKSRAQLIVTCNTLGISKPM